MPTGTNNTPRLLVAAKEFNIGKDTLVEHLKTKGFEIDGKPSTKLSEEMYEALQKEFAQDRLTKRKSEAIDLPKVNNFENLKLPEEANNANGTSNKKDEPQQVANTEIKEKQPTPEPLVVTPPTVEVPKAESVIEVEKESPVEKETQKEIPAIEEKVVEKVQEPVPSQEPKVEVVHEEPKLETPKVETANPKVETNTPVVQPIEKVEETTNEVKPLVEKSADEDAVVEHIETVAPKLTGPVVLDKINLDELNMSTRPKKGSFKEKDKFKRPEDRPNQSKEQAPKQASPTNEKPIVPVTTEKVNAKPVEVNEPVQKPAEVIKPSAEEDNKPEHIDLKAPKLEGPKILGKIELPVSSPSGRDAHNNEKKKRKRIPFENKNGGGSNSNNNNNNRPNNNNANVNNGGNNGGQFNRNNNRGNNPQGANNNRPNNQQGGGNRGNNQQGGGNNRNQQGGGGGNYNNNRNNNNRGGNRNNNQQNSNVPQEVDAKQIQDKIRETQAKLAIGGNRGVKNQKSKYRRNKREEMAEKRQLAEEAANTDVLQVTEFISVSELANLLDVNFADVISKCMSLGIMVSINQRLDAEVIELVAGEFGREVSFINMQQDSDEEVEEIDDPADLQPRAPIVTIMGHVDHGKTSLLDYIRSSSVVAGEAGGITQHIGAYRVTTDGGKNLTFLDTPGHEAFTAMRARGAKAADVAVIVIAADDNIMPQTKEAIAHAQAAGLPMVFAINKIDKEGANPEKIKEQLSAMNILVEDWGGKFQSQEISAKKGLNVNLLLEKILLESEMLELKANPDREAIGSIIEASLDKGRGYVSTVLVHNGTLKMGDMIVSGQYLGKVKAMFNERGARVTKAGPSTPVQVLGLNGAPQAGEKFKVYADESEAKTIANRRSQILREQGIRTRKHITLDEIGRRLALGSFKELNVIIKGDFDGSVEALSDSLQKLSTEEVVVSIVHKGVGAITESDVLLASASDAIIIGFQVRPSAQAGRLADQENIEIRTYSIIYDAIDEIKSAMEGMLEPKIEKRVVGNIEIKETFKISGVGVIAGCMVLDGKISRNTKLNLIRDGIVIYTGELGSLKRYKDDAKEVIAGQECGLSIKNYNDVHVGDILEGYDEIEVKRKL